MTFSNSSDYSAYYAISLEYQTVGTSPTPSMNAFLFDKTAVTPYSTKNQEYADSWRVSKQKITAISEIISPADKIVLGIIKTGPDSGGIPGELQTGWTLDSIASVGGVIDLRPTYLLRINHELLDDTKIIFKDRDSWGTSFADIKLETDELKASEIESTGDMIVGDDLEVTGTSTLLTDQGYVEVGSSGNNTGISYKKGSTIIAKQYAYTSGTHSYFNFLLRSLGTYPEQYVYMAHGEHGPQIGINTIPLAAQNIDFHLFKEGSLHYPTIRIEASSVTPANLTLYDIYGKNDDEDSDAALIFQPRTYNRPVQFLDKDGTLVFAIDASSGDVIAYDDFHVTDDLTVGNNISVTGNATVGGTLTTTGTSALLGAVTASSTLNVTGATTLSTATVSTLTISDLVQVSTDGT